MLFAVRFTDKPDQLPVRLQYLQAHINWLHEVKDIVLVGGSLRDDPQNAPIGGLWVVEAEGKEAIRRLIESDPFWIHGLREGYEILHWSKAHPGRMVPI